MSEKRIQDLLELSEELIVYCGCSSKHTTGTSKGGCC